MAEASGKTGNGKKVDVDAVMASEPTLSNTLNEKNNQSSASAQGGMIMLRITPIHRFANAGAIALNVLTDVCV